MDLLYGQEALTCVVEERLVVGHYSEFSTDKFRLIMLKGLDYRK